MIAGVLSATMSTADSQLLVAASSITNDLPAFAAKNSVWLSRLVVVLLSIGAVIVALTGTPEIFSKVLFAWSAMGAAFGPLLLVILLKGPVRKAYALAAMALGFSLSVGAYSMAYSRGTWLERVLPFAVALIIAYAGSRNVVRDVSRNLG
jgi:sodium/proline symporter